MLPSRPLDDDAIEDLLSAPPPAVVAAMGRIDGDWAVLGVGGKMGTTVARMVRRALDAAGRSARVIGVSRFRDPAARAALSRHGVEPVGCDLAEPDEVAALPDCPNVLHLAGQKFGTQAAPDETWVQNVVVPDRVARRYRASRIVAFSTGCVYPFVPVDGAGAREETPVALLGEYAASCVGRERVFAHAARRWGTRVLLFRLNYAVELRYGVLVDLGLKLLRGEPIDLTMGHVNLIWQGDAAARAILCLELAAAPARALNVTGPVVLRVRDLAEELGWRLGCVPRFSGAEAPTAWLADAGESVRLFGPPETPLPRILDRVAEHLRAGGRLLGKPTHFEARDGNF